MDEKRIHTESTVMKKSNNGLGLSLYKIADCVLMCFSSVRNRRSARTVSRPRNKRNATTARAAISPCRLAESSGDVILGLFLAGIDENLVGDIEFDQFAHVHVSGVVRHARCLLHVVRDDGDGVVGLEFVQQFLDLRGGDGI